MTDYQTHSSKNRKKQKQYRLRNLVGIIVTVALIFAVFNGAVKEFSPGSYFAKSSWDGSSNFAAVLNTRPFSILVFQNDPSRLVLISLNEEASLATGDFEKPLDKVLNVIDKKDGKKMMTVSSLMTRSPVRNYIFFEDERSADKATLEKFFLSSASLFSPITTNI